MDNINEATINYLRRLRDEQFWGTLALKFEGGRVVHLRREENLKPNELSGEPRLKYGSQKSSS